jgi:TPP-dependent pyruvate/acetoin dehydrogenase alpha subunit
MPNQTHEAVALTESVINEMYRLMFLIRRVEERTADIYHTDKIKSPIHLSIGQEPPSVGVCMALHPNDVVFGTYRGHALYLAKGGDLNNMVAELYGKATGCGKGKAGSMHLGDKVAGMMGTSAIVSTTIPQAVGYALAEKMKGKDTVVPVFFGDGATEEGVFWESLNFAALMKLSVLFVCENNHYAIHTPWTKRIPQPNYCERVAAFDVPASRVANNDIIKTFREASRLVAELRGGGGPHFLEVETYRWREHVGPSEDWHLGYRSKEEGEIWMARDEMARIGYMIPVAKRIEIEAECEVRVEAAFDFAEASPFPDNEELYRDVFQ